MELANYEMSARIVELQDSLRAYRDSLKQVQTYWTFNTVSSLVKMKDYEVKLGDTCALDVFLVAGNDLHQYFRHEDPVLEITRTGEVQHSTSIRKNEGTGWHVWFIPNKVCSDSVVGRIIVPDQRGYSDTVELPFGVRYTVLPK